MTIFIGIEGGATKSSGVLVDGKTGKILKEITGGPANVWVGFCLEIRLMAERSEAKSSKQSFASKNEILFFLKRSFASRSKTTLRF